MLDFIQRPVVVAAVCVLAVLGIGGALTRIGPWYFALRKPSWQPPGWVFAPVWSTIGALTVWAVVAVWPHLTAPGSRTMLIALFAGNALFNIAWSWLFFTAKRPDWAMVEVFGLWLSVAALVVALWPYSTLAACLLLPYLLWVTIAAFLNLAIVRLNRPFGATARTA